MAEKKKPTAEDELMKFKDILKRSKITNLAYLNNTMISLNTDTISTILIPDSDLWNLIINDNELKDHIVEYDQNVHETDMRDKFVYGSNLDNEIWISIDPEVILNGSLMNINVSGFSYNIPINKGLFPLKFRKAECNSFMYRVTKHKENTILILRKLFESKVEKCNLNMITIYVVV